ncbi:MAG TPA: response regulator [Ktedonobacterales bacterium]|jgi:CheY-like chemotaxis protein
MNGLQDSATHAHEQARAHQRAHALPSILLVEDDQDIRDTLRMAFEDEGYVVLEAEDGIAALNLLRKSMAPLVVTLDLRMPRLNGDALLQHVSKREHLPAQHAYLLITANRELLSPASLRLLKRMDVLVVSKPFDLNDLLDLVAHAADALDSPGAASPEQ